MTAFLCTNVAEAAVLLRSGGLVAFPTETVYGLGADATNPIAVARIFESKQRPAFDPLIVHVGSLDQLNTVVASFPPLAQRLAEAFWPGPLTLVLPKTAAIPELVTAGLPGVGVRIPAHPLALELLNEVGFPLAAPSANPFGAISPTTVQHVQQGLGDRIDGILDGGPCQVGLESTVISLMDSQPALLRPGGCPLEAIVEVAGTVLTNSVEVTNGTAQPAPGMLSRHYAPGTRLILLDRDQIATPLTGQRCGLLTEGTQKWTERFDRIEVLSEDGDLKTCAAGFFAAMRSLDSAGLDVIIAHRFPNSGLGLALNDRLRRASVGSSSEK